MRAFVFDRPAGVDEALTAAARGAQFLAGGTNLVDLMKEDVARPAALADITRLPLRDITRDGAGALVLGALATNAATANHPLVREHAPLLRSAILAGASPQIRNRATNGGNLLQRTRCVYFYDTGVPCNKREPGSGCPAASGLARQHAVLGASPQCIATHPSDLCVALAALDAQVHVRSLDGVRVVPFDSFHRLPGDRPDLDTTLRPGELVTHLVLPPGPFATHHAYLKLRERASYAFALVSVAAALDLGPDGDVRAARIALGGVAHKPWRDSDAEAGLVGRPADDVAFTDAARRLMRDARAWGGPAAPEGTPGNQFKIPLAERAIVRALQMARAGITTNTGEDAFRRDGDAAATEERR